MKIELIDAVITGVIAIVLFSLAIIGFSSDNDVLAIIGSLGLVNTRLWLDLLIRIESVKAENVKEENRI